MYINVHKYVPVMCILAKVWGKCLFFSEFFFTCKYSCLLYIDVSIQKKKTQKNKNREIKAQGSHSGRTRTRGAKENTSGQTVPLPASPEPSPLNTGTLLPREGTWPGGGAAQEVGGLGFLPSHHSALTNRLRDSRGGCRAALPPPEARKSSLQNS